MRVLLDSNVYISGLGFGGTPGEILAFLNKNEGWEILVSSFLAEEVKRTMASKKFNWPNDKIVRALRLLFKRATWIEPDAIPSVTRDPKDDPILACALAGGAHYLVTGDKDLLSLDRHKNLRIITPRQFMDML